MQTLADLLSERRALVGGQADYALRIPNTPRPQIRVPAERALTLPNNPGDLTILDRQVANGALKVPPMARISLVYHPTFVAPLRNPEHKELVALGRDPDNFRHENTRCLCVGVQVATSSGSVLFGIARIIALENGVRMGKTALLAVDDFWSTDIDEATAKLFELLRDSKDSVRPEPEPSARAWRTVVALLGGTNDTKYLPVTWMRDFRLLAGLYCIRLDIRPSPEAARAIIIAELRSEPPTGLLVWRDWVAHPEVFINVYLSARPGAYAELLGTGDLLTDFGDLIGELRLHFNEVTSVPSSQQTADAEATWPRVHLEVLRLTGPHFTLTERAVSMLKGNPYPKPERMLRHLRRLADFAESYHASNGQLGARLETFAIDKFGIEIALFDKSLINKEIEFGGRSFNTQPHVKVDDYKSPADVGRIYFALDTVMWRLIVDHIGLHDYS